MTFIVSSIVGAIGSNSAADTQASADKQASQTQMQMFNTINQQEQPFIQAGYGATNSLDYLLGINTPNSGSTPNSSSGTGSVPMSSLMGLNGGLMQGLNGIKIPQSNGSTTSQSNGFTAPQAGSDFGANSGLPAGYLTQQFTPQDFEENLDPGYQFALQTGGQALRNADTPGVGALSGAALKDLMNFNVGTANQGYQNAFNRFTTQQNNIFSRLSGIAGLGQNAASNTGTAGTALGTGAAQAQAAAGAAQAGGIVGATNALTQGGSLAYLYGNQNSGDPSTVPNTNTALGPSTDGYTTGY